MGERAVDWSNLNKEIVQAIGSYLDARSWAAARTSCKAWSSSVTGDIRLLEIDLERCAHRWMMTVTCVARLFPRLTSITLLVGHRISPEVLAERMEALSISGIKLVELNVRFVYTNRPMIGSWLEDLSGLTHLKQLKVLRLGGGATPAASFFDQLRSLKQLEMLEVLPGAYGQLFNAIDVDMPSAAGQADADGGLCDVHLVAIAQLTQLKQLTLKVNPCECSVDGFRSLAASGLMTNLEHLSLYDSELPSSCLPESLKGASRLTRLQLGLSNVDDLSAVGKLPKLKSLSLDTAFLPELRELVYAAARAGVPATGPGAITGLCLMEQAVSNPLQLASLSQLSSLAELVIVNPFGEPPAHSAAGATETVSTSEHHEGVKVDVTALAGLRKLQLLQVDLKGWPPPRVDDDSNPAFVPLKLQFNAAGVQQLAMAWESLVTLDLNGFGQDLLPAEAVGMLSQFKALRHLTVTVEDSGAAVGQQRTVGWWQLPKGLCTLILSHFDLTRSCNGNTSSGSEGCVSGPCGSKCCCMAEVQPGPSGQSQRPQRRYSPAGLTSRVQGFLSPHISPICPLSKDLSMQLHRRQQQRDVLGANNASGTASRASSSSTGGDDEEGAQREAQVSVDAATTGAAAAEFAAAAAVCPCAARVASHFSRLEALWLDHCKLPRNFLAYCLPAAASCLQSLALLHGTGTPQPELSAALSGLSGLSSLRLIPVEYPLGGLRQLLPLCGLKKLNVRLMDLQPDDLLVLPQLRSLFCLSLTAPLGDDGELQSGLQPAQAAQAAVRLSQVLEVVRQCLPYCDLELHAEAEANN